MMMKKILLGFVLAISLNLMAQEDARLLRFPAVHGQKVVFT